MPRAVAAAVAATLAFASLPAMAIQPIAPFTGGNPGISLPVINANTDGWGVSEVITPAQRFVHTGGGNWQELGNDGARFNFIEVQRDEWSVYLRDDSRGVNLQLDLHRKQVLYSDDGGRSFPLVDIVAANGLPRQGQIGQAASISIVEYTCNEGIPLIVEYEDLGNESWATWTHDGFRGNKLPLVVSGSGTKYSDGLNTVWEKGGQVYLNLNGIEDSCSR